MFIRLTDQFHFENGSLKGFFFQLENVIKAEYRRVVLILVKQTWATFGFEYFEQFHSKKLFLSNLSLIICFLNSFSSYFSPQPSFQTLARALWRLNILGSDLQLKLFFEFRERIFERAQEQVIAQLNWVILEDYNWLFYFLHYSYKHFLTLHIAVEAFLIDLRLHIEQEIQKEQW